MNGHVRRQPNRRQFLSVVARGATAASVGLAALARAADAKGKAPAKWEMRLSTSSIHYQNVPIEKACEEIAALGFDAIDIWSAHAGCPHLDDVLRRLGPEGLVHLLGKNKLKLFAFSTYRGGYARYAELLGKAGGGVAVQGSGGRAKPAELTAKMKKFLETRKPLIELCEKHNSYLACENHGGALLNTVDSLKAFVDLNTSPRLGIALAPYHLQGIKASVPEAIRACGEQLFFFYAWQRAGSYKQLPGHGPTDFTPWIAALAEVGYRGCVNPFAHIHPKHLKTEEMSAALKKSRDYLRTCYDKAVGQA